MNLLLSWTCLFAIEHPFAGVVFHNSSNGAMKFWLGLLPPIWYFLTLTHRIFFNWNETTWDNQKGKKGMCLKQQEKVNCTGYSQLVSSMFFSIVSNKIPDLIVFQTSDRWCNLIKSSEKCHILKQGVYICLCENNSWMEPPSIDTSVICPISIGIQLKCNRTWDNKKWRGKAYVWSSRKKSIAPRNSQLVSSMFSSIVSTKIPDLIVVHSSDKWFNLIKSSEN